MSRLGVAFAAGLLSPVNPCGIAVLPAFLSLYLHGPNDEEHDWPSRLWGGFAVGGSVSVGFVAVYLAVGLLASAGLRWVVRAAPWTAILLGVALVGMGVAIVLGRHIGLRVGQPLRPGQDRRRRNMVVFGAAYALASVSCTLALLLAMVSQALATSTVAGVLAVFAAYGAGAATLVTALSVSAALATGAVGRVRRLAPMLERVAGGLLVVAGLYLVAYWVPVALGDRPGRSLASLSEDLSARLVSFLDARWRFFALIGAALAISAVLLAVYQRRRRPAPSEAACCPTEMAESVSPGESRQRPTVE